MTINNSSVASEGVDLTDGQITKINESPRDKSFFEKKKNFLNKCVTEKLVIGDAWYLLEKRWYKQLKKYIDVGRHDNEPQNEYPGPIDNSSLCETETTKVKEHLLEGSDYKLINEEGWNELVKWFGIVEGQEPIKRYVIEHGLFTKDTQVEIYPLHLQLCLFKNLEKLVSKYISKTTTLENVVKIMKETLDIPGDEEVRLWSRFMQNTYELLVLNQSKTLQDQGINSGQTLVLEQKDNKGQWPRQTRTRSLSGSSSKSFQNFPPETFKSSGGSNAKNSNSRHSISSNHKRGLCGLSNIGNTCFMNAALQCLSNTTPLMKYFLANTYESELNPNNPLGMHGKIAEAYAELMRQMWSDTQSFVTPRQFKTVVGRFAPRFSGYQQHDSQELLAFLLDGLHEDLNRVKQKPYLEIPDDKGRPDDVLAKEAWENHSKRNRSIITDNFHGLFKSTVECPDCGKKSITFDPFCYLSLPLPVKRERSLRITFVPIDHSKSPVKMKVVIPKMGTTPVLCQAVSKLTGVDSDKLIVTDVFNSKFHKKYSRNESLNQMTDKDDIYVYEIPVSVNEMDENDLVVIPLYMRSISNKNRSSYSYSNNLFGIPMLIVVSKESTTADDLYHVILKAMRRFVTVPKPKSEEKMEEGIEIKEEIKQEEVKKEEVKKEEVKKEEVKKEENSTKAAETEAIETEDTKTEATETEATENKDTSLEKEANETDVQMAEEEDWFSADEEPEKHESETKENTPIPAKLFELKIVNHGGNSDLRSLNYDNSEPLRLSCRQYLCADWYPKLKEKYFNHQASEKKEEHSSYREVLMQKKAAIQLDDCLELFLQQEKLGEHDPWYCPECKEHRQAFKKFDLWSLPKILVIHLKRFSYNRYWRDKLDALVNFPVTSLDMTNYVINKKHPRAVYDLHAVSNHYGGMGGGHYTAYAMNCYDGQWHYFDDSSVSLSDASSPVSKAAYVLFYTRRDDPDNGMMNTSDLLTEDAFMDE